MTMSRSHVAFTESIKDAENLLAFFDQLNAKPPPPELEVLRRAGLVMAMTAWETYVEDRVVEAATERLAGISDSALAGFVRGRMEDELRRLHNPSSDKTFQLFKDYAGVNVWPQWTWNNIDPQAASQPLDAYLKLLGGVVHRSRVVVKGPPQPDPVTREVLQKAIGLLKELVKATDRASSAPATA